MTLELRMGVDGVGRVEARFDDLGDKAANPGPLWERLYAGFLGAERSRFDTRGYGHWRPILPATSRRKIARGQDPRTLRATGALYRSLTSRGAPGSVYRTTSSSVIFGSSLDQAIYQQGGEGRRDRPVIVLSRRMKKQFAQTIDEWMKS
ncbi:hypothetical protein [Kineosporia succinea]|uniref:Bacteriophage HK97-gp10 tail-component n=1 Tax=Kineosporia succinea TaxID=84632 RepID=A0ABT9PB94_9ACTN|nr:hypothetical protein [Kineosporia succinea]MDP9829455.1 hypothetical protein [Kineosporia succinea]